MLESGRAKAPICVAWEAIARASSRWLRFLISSSVLEFSRILSPQGTTLSFKCSHCHPASDRDYDGQHHVGLRHRPGRQTNHKKGQPSAHHAVYGAAEIVFGNDDQLSKSGRHVRSFREQKQGG